MTNKQIAGFLMVLSWLMLIGSVAMGSAVFSFYSVICIGMSYVIWLGVNNKPPSGRMRH